MPQPTNLELRTQCKKAGLPVTKENGGYMNKKQLASQLAQHGGMRVSSSLLIEVIKELNNDSLILTDDFYRNSPFLRGLNLTGNEIINTEPILQRITNFIQKIIHTKKNTVSKTIVIYSRAPGGKGDMVSAKNFVELATKYGHFKFRVITDSKKATEYINTLSCVDKATYDEIFVVPKAVEKGIIKLAMDDFPESTCPELFIAIPLLNVREGTRPGPHGEPRTYFNTVDCPSTKARISFEYNPNTFNPHQPSQITGVFINEFLFLQPKPVPGYKPAPTATDDNHVLNMLTREYGHIQKDIALRSLINEDIARNVHKSLLENPEEIYFGYSAHNASKILYICKVLSSGRGSNKSFHLVNETGGKFWVEFKDTIEKLGVTVIPESEYECYDKLGNLLDKSKIINRPQLKILFNHHISDREIKALTSLISGLSHYKTIHYIGESESEEYLNPFAATGAIGTIYIYLYKIIPHNDMLNMRLLSHPFTLVTGDQSLLEALSIGQIPFYETQHWKKDFSNALINTISKNKSEKDNISKLFFELVGSSIIEKLSEIEDINVCSNKLKDIFQKFKEDELQKYNIEHEIHEFLTEEDEFLTEEDEYETLADAKWICEILFGRVLNGMNEFYNGMFEFLEDGGDEEEYQSDMIETYGATTGTDALGMIIKDINKVYILPFRKVT